jgi:hypothetical protein
LGVERPQQPVLALGDPRRQLLERVIPAVQLDEADDVAADAALDLDDERLGPLLQWDGPRQVEQRALVLAGDEAEVRGRASGGNGGDL